MSRWSARNAAIALAASGPALETLIDVVGPVRMRRPTVGPHGHFQALVRSIAFQQLAGRAAATIHGRLVATLGEVRPDAVVGAGMSQLRSAGLSSAKAASVLDLAQRVTDGSLDLAAVARRPDAEVVARLTEVRGIGRWTAEMFLIFQLRRPDVWPVGDLGVRRGFARIHGLSADPTPAELETLGEPFRPWRSALAWYCWRAVDTVLPEGGTGGTVLPEGGTGGTVLPEGGTGGTVLPER